MCGAEFFAGIYRAVSSCAQFALDCLCSSGPLLTHESYPGWLQHQLRVQVRNLQLPTSQTRNHPAGRLGVEVRGPIDANRAIEATHEGRLMESLAQRGVAARLRLGRKTYPRPPHPPPLPPRHTLTTVLASLQKGRAAEVHPAAASDLP
jgi:hypothetical protein